MDLEEIRKLVRLMEEAGLSELEIENRSGKVRVVRGGARSVRGEAPASRDGRSGEPEVVLAPLSGADPAGPPPAAGETGTVPGTTVISSPMVGTFYRAPSPDAPPFVSEGDLVQVGQVVCIIEAMKMMNEIHAETAGRIVRIAVENGAPVEYGSTLFLLAPEDEEG